MAGIRRRGKTFTITVYMGYDAQGKQRKKTTTYRPPQDASPGRAEKLARAYAAAWEEQVRGYTALDENRTFAALEAWYYTEVAPAVLKPNVLLNSKKDIENHVLPRLGRERLKNITPGMIDGLLRDLQENGRLLQTCRLRDRHLLDGVHRAQLAEKAGVPVSTVYFALRGNALRREKAAQLAGALGMKLDALFEDAEVKNGLSGASVNKIKRNLSAIFSAAVKKELMRRNPCALATPPKNDTQPALYLNEAQCSRFLALLQAQPDTRFAVYCSLMLATGLRPGECAALHWDDLDPETGVLHVRHTLVRTGGRFVRQTPKTAQSIRTIVLPRQILVMLAAHREAQAGQSNRNGSVFTNRSGDYVNNICMNAKLKRLLTGSGLPQIHLHSLRHTYASLLINGDVAARIVADRLGHASTGTTLNIYSHVFAASAVRAMQVVERTLFAGSPV